MAHLLCSFAALCFIVRLLLARSAIMTDLDHYYDQSGLSCCEVLEIKFMHPSDPWPLPGHPEAGCLRREQGLPLSQATCLRCGGCRVKCSCVATATAPTTTHSTAANARS